MIEKHTVESYAEKEDISRQSAINKLHRLKKKGYVKTSGGGKQKRIYTISDNILRETNGFYDVVNKYSPEKIVPRFEHIVRGRYGAEEAIIDGLSMGDARTRDAIKHLFRHIKDWKRLFELAKEKKLEDDVRDLYLETRKEMKTKKMPKRYMR